MHQSCIMANYTINDGTTTTFIFHIIKEIEKKNCSDVIKFIRAFSEQKKMGFHSSDGAKLYVKTLYFNFFKHKCFTFFYPLSSFVDGISLILK